MIPGWLHAAAWWCVIASAVAVWWIDGARGASLFARGYARGTLGGYLTVALLLLLISGCPPAHSATLRWTAPLWQEATTPLGHRCLLSLVPERVALCLVVRQPPNGIARCVAKLPCVRGQAMAWTVPDSLRGAYFDVVAADSAGNHSCAGNAVWVP